MINTLKCKNKYQNRLSTKLDEDADLSMTKFQRQFAENRSIKSFYHQISKNPFGFNLLCEEQVIFL